MQTGEDMQDRLGESSCNTNKAPFFTCMDREELRQPGVMLLVVSPNLEQQGVKRLE